MCESNIRMVDFLNKKNVMLVHFRRVVTILRKHIDVYILKSFLLSKLSFPLRAYSHHMKVEAKAKKI